MRPLILALCLILAFLCCAQADAAPVRRVLGFVAGKARAAAAAPLKVRPLRRLVGGGC